MAPVSVVRTEGACTGMGVAAGVAEASGRAVPSEELRPTVSFTLTLSLRWATPFSVSPSMLETVKVNESPFSASEGMVTGMVTVPLEVVEPERLVAINPEEDTFRPRGLRPEAEGVPTDRPSLPEKFMLKPRYAPCAMEMATWMFTVSPAFTFVLEAEALTE